jgi:hypothetical protein
MRFSSAALGGVFRYSMTLGSMPLSLSEPSTLREVEQLGLW